MRPPSNHAPWLHGSSRLGIEPKTPGWLVQDSTTSPSGDLIPTIRGSGAHPRAGLLHFSKFPCRDRVFNRHEVYPVHAVHAHGCCFLAVENYSQKFNCNAVELRLLNLLRSDWGEEVQEREKEIQERDGDGMPALGDRACALSLPCVLVGPYLGPGATRARSPAPPRPRSAQSKPGLLRARRG
jgi:hypothetical protein